MSKQLLDQKRLEIRALEMDKSIPQEEFVAAWDLLQAEIQDLMVKFEPKLKRNQKAYDFLQSEGFTKC